MATRRKWIELGFGMSKVMGEGDWAQEVGWAAGLGQTNGPTKVALLGLAWIVGVWLDDVVFDLERKDKDYGLDECALTVRYVVRSLVSGVSSSREFARQGVALGLLVRQKGFDLVLLSNLMGLVLEAAGGFKGWV
ncbi:hypothetical protein Droror1_Dr00019823 [Drosera rotundifolia]